MINSKENKKIIYFINEFDLIIISNKSQFANNLLSKYFSHSNYHSFSSQLKTYNFITITNKNKNYELIKINDNIKKSKYFKINDDLNMFQDNNLQLIHNLKEENKILKTQNTTLVNDINLILNYEKEKQENLPEEIQLLFNKYSLVKKESVPENMINSIESKSNDKSISNDNSISNVNFISNINSISNDDNLANVNLEYEYDYDDNNNINNINSENFIENPNNLEEENNSLDKIVDNTNRREIAKFIKKENY